MSTGKATASRSALLVDDLPAARDWLKRALQAAFGDDIEIHEAGSLKQAFDTLDRLPTGEPELALIDLGLPDGSGVRVIDALRDRGGGTSCIVSSIFDDDAHIFPALRAGAQGYVLKDLPAAALADMLLGTLTGQPALSPSIARRLLRQFQLGPLVESGPPGAAPIANQEQLTPRETEVLQMIAKGYTVQQTAVTLDLSPHTTAGYVKDIYRKLSVNSRAEATLEAAKRGLVSSV